MAYYCFHICISNHFNSLGTLQITKYNILKSKIQIVIIIYSIIHNNGLMDNDPYLNRPINSNVQIIYEYSTKKSMKDLPTYQYNIIITIPIGF